jgi:hypothetical protein
MAMKDNEIWEKEHKTRKEILQAITLIQLTGVETVQDTQIVNKLGLTLEKVRVSLLKLHQEGCIEFTNDGGRYSKSYLVTLTAEGKKVLQEPDHIHQNMRRFRWQAEVYVQRPKGFPIKSNWAVVFYAGNGQWTDRYNHAKIYRGRELAEQDAQVYQQSSWVRNIEIFEDFS